MLRDAADVAAAWDELGGRGPSAPRGVRARSTGSSRCSRCATCSATPGCWPLVENQHADGILRVSSGARARHHRDAAGKRGTTRSTALLDDLDYVGVLTLELFQVGGRLLANEMAPRVHNSGHWTIEGAVTSQFENHVRAVLGWPLGSTEPRGMSAMVNCIGALPEPDDVLAIEGAHLHRYGKAPRPGRKVGHVTVVADDHAALEGRIRTLRAVLPPQDGR